MFLLDYVMSLLVPKHKIDYILSYIGLADLISLIPIIGVILTLAGVSVGGYFSIWIQFLYVFRLVNIFQVVQVRRSLFLQR